MASSGGKKGKQRWKAMDIAKVETSWADEVDKVFSSDTMDFMPNKSIILPTAPRASRGNIVDESKIPNNGPFQAHLSNIPYEINEDELASYFDDMKIKNVKIPRKGFAYIEFDDRQSLILALNLGEANIKGRTTRIELSIHGMDGGRGMGGRPGGGRGGGRDMGMGLRDSLQGPDRTSGNWRQGSRPEDDDRGHDRGPMGGSRREFSSGSFSRGYGGSGFDSRDSRGFSDHFGERSNFRSGFKDDDKDRYSSRDDRGPRGMDDRGFGKYERNDRDRERDRDRDRDGKYMRRDERSEPPKGESKLTRPKLNLKPRTEPTSACEPGAGAVAAAGSQSAIFGGAKPVDTSARDREIEKRLAAKNSEHYEPRGGKLGGMSSGRSKGGENWSDDRKAEPAPLPKDNAWARKANNPPVNNGRSSPDEELHHDDLQRDEDSGEDTEGAQNEPIHDQQAKSSDDDTRGKGGTAAGSDLPRGGLPEKSRGKETERQPAHKQRDPRREPTDELAKMPKVQEASTPNFAGQNKFSSLVSDESCVD